MRVQYTFKGNTLIKTNLKSGIETTTKKGTPEFKKATRAYKEQLRRQNKALLKLQKSKKIEDNVKAIKQQKALAKKYETLRKRKIIKIKPKINDLKIKVTFRFSVKITCHKDSPQFMAGNDISDNPKDFERFVKTRNKLLDRVKKSFPKCRLEGGSCVKLLKIINGKIFVLKESNPYIISGCGYRFK